MQRNYCRSVISLQEPLPHSLWISLNLYGILAIVWTPAYSVVSICVRWPPKRRVHNITSSTLLHRKYPLLLCCLLKVSQYRLALIDTASVNIVKGISQHIHNNVRLRYRRQLTARLSDQTSTAHSSASAQAALSFCCTTAAASAACCSVTSN